MNKISDRIANLLWEQGILQDDDVSKCSYGLDIFISSIAEVLSILIISAFVHNFAETLLFFTSFIPLRVYAGGYHAETRVKCFLMSIVVYVIFTMIVRITPTELYLPLNISLTILSLIIVLAAAPVIHHNKNVSTMERVNYRKISLRLCFIETTIVLMLIFIIPKSRFVTSIVLGQTAVTLSMLAAIIKNKLCDNK